MTSEPDPPWVRDAVRAVGRELGAFALTLWAIASTPARFAADWAAGRRHALNPLAFLLNALAIVGPWRALCGRLLDPNPPTTPLWFEILKPLFPIVLSMTVTALFHLLLKPLGGRRALTSSLGMSMYVSGGPLSVLNFALAPLVLYGFIHRDNVTVALTSAVANLALLGVFFFYLIVTQAALHRLPRWRVTIAVVVAWVAFGVVSARLSIHHPNLMRSFLEG